MIVPAVLVLATLVFRALGGTRKTAKTAKTAKTRESTKTTKSPEHV